MNPSAGWTTLINNTVGADDQCQIVYKIADGTEGTTVTPFTNTTSWTAGLWEVQGAAASTLFAASGIGTSSSGTVGTVTSGVPSNHCLLVGLIQSQLASTTTAVVSGSGVTSDDTANGTRASGGPCRGRNFHAADVAKGSITATVTFDVSGTLGLSYVLLGPSI
jgi:hypothetical protein